MERTNFCCLIHLVYGILLWQPGLTSNTHNWEHFAMQEELRAGKAFLRCLANLDIVYQQLLTSQKERAPDIMYLPMEV